LEAEPRLLLLALIPYLAPLPQQAAELAEPTAAVMAEMADQAVAAVLPAVLMAPEALVTPQVPPHPKVAMAETVAVLLACGLRLAVVAARLK